MPVRTTLFCWMLLVLWALPIHAVYYPLGDLDEGRDVDFADLSLLCAGWLDPACQVPGCEADLNGRDGVNLVDFALLARDWGGTPIITEFMASNHAREPLSQGEILDEDGESSDWIEIHNPTDTPVNLTGWYLTHDPCEPTEWRFPAVTLDPGAFLVVFASGKNRRDSDPNKPLHTSFNLDKGGDYLAIVRPDGKTVVHEYAPEYPRQLQDVSYGLAQYAQVLVPAGAEARYYVPTAADDELDWTAYGYDDSRWESGPTGLGFGNVSPGFTVTFYKANISVAHLDTAESVIANASYQASVVTETAPVINYYNTGGTGRFGNDNPFPGTTIGTNVEDFVVLVTGTVYIPATGNWTFGVNSDDGFGLELTRGQNTFSSSYPDPRGTADTLAVFDIPQAGTYNLRLVFYERGGGSALELFAAQGSHAAFNGAFSLVGDTQNGGLAASSFTSEANTDVQGIMQNANASLWARIEFEAEEVEFFSSMTLRVRYEDGFVAYLNGEEIARANLTGLPAWSSAADANRPPEASSEFVSFDVSGHIAALREGRNVLAVQGLNDSKDDGQFLILPELVAAGEVSVAQYFDQATPGQYNTAGSLDLVDDTVFSHDRGFYDTPFDVTITTATSGATIHYTTDGSTPSETYGIEYTGPIHISTTTCLRAMAFKPGWVSTNVDTHTYIFLNDVIHQPADPPGFPGTWGATAADYQMDPDIVNDPVYGPKMRQALLSLPSISIVTDTDNLFGPSGIYTNPGGHGVAWERPASVEWINPDGSTAFQVDCGLRIYGGAFRGMGLTRKKTFRLLFKRQYGPTKLRYPLFSEDATDQFDTIILRGGANDAWNNWGKEKTQYIVDEFMRRTQLALGQPSGHGTFAHLYLNGLYWGLYNPVERPERSFAATYFGGDKDEWDALNSGAGVGGSSTATWGAMLSIIRNGVADTEAYQRLQGNNPDGTPNPAYDDLLDVDNYIDYMFCNFWGGTGDWPGHNWYGACRRPPNATGFKFFNWDSEGAIIIWSSLNANVTGVGNGAGEPYAALRQNSEFCMLFADHAHRHLFNGGPATYQPSYERYKQLAETVSLAIIAESARWGDQARSTPYTHQDWQSKVDYILGTYMPQRPNIVLAQLRNAGLYPNVEAPVFHVNGSYQHGGQIASDHQLTMTAPEGTIYYSIDGNDVRVPAEIEIVGTTLVPEDAPKYVLVPTEDIGTAWRGGAAFDHSAWTFVEGTPGGVGYDENPNYDPYISLDVESQMNGDLNPAANTSAYIRIPFALTAEQVASFNFMKLRVRYDDGFVAFINGTRVEAQNFSGEPAWNSRATRGHSDSAAVQLLSFDISGHLGTLVPGQNILAVQGLNSSTTSSDFLISAELVAGESSPTSELLSDSAIEYTGPITLPHSMHIKSRTLRANTWSALNEATFAVGPVKDCLRITEIMFHNLDTGDPNDPNAEYVELMNIGSQGINLNMVRFTNGIDFTFPSIELEAGGRILVVKDLAAFYARYPAFSGTIAGEYSGNLDNAGERIELQDATGNTILEFRYGDDWRPVTDGGGFSLTIVDPADPDPNNWGRKDSWRASVYPGGSPGYDDSGILPDPGAIAINEVMAHSHDTEPDWIELYNTTEANIPIGGWYLSDSAADLKKYRIADGTQIPAHGFLLFDEHNHFGLYSTDPGRITPFALSENGEAVYLTSALGQTLTGYREYEDFGASETGVSFGRYFKRSTGNYNFVHMDHPTPGRPNAYPKVGPVVITEIMYNPASSGDAEEYIELHNVGPTEIELYDFSLGLPWRFTDGIDFEFPQYPGVSIPAGGYLLVVKDKDAFAAAYGQMPSDVPVLGPYDGKLSDAGEKLELSKPGDVDRFGARYYIRIDRVNYSDGSHPQNVPGGIDLWPTEPDGGGASLVRIDPARYGNDPNNWQARSAPNPGLQP